MRVKKKTKRYSKFNSMVMLIETTINSPWRLRRLWLFCLYIRDCSCSSTYETWAEFDHNLQPKRFCPTHNCHYFMEKSSLIYSHSLYIIYNLFNAFLDSSFAEMLQKCRNTLFNMLWFPRMMNDFKQLSREWVWTCCSQSMVGIWTYKYSDAIPLVCERWGVSVTANLC